MQTLVQATAGRMSLPIRRDFPPLTYPSQPFLNTKVEHRKRRPPKFSQPTLPSERVYFCLTGSLDDKNTAFGIAYA